MNHTKRLYILLAAAVIAVQSALATEPAGYYNKALGQSDEKLMSALCSTIRSHKEVSYGNGLLNAFAIADVDNQGYIIDIYSNCRYRPSDNGSSASHVGEGYNREHSFPRSWFGGEVSPMNTDVFHIYPTDIKVNSQRGNNPYGVCANGTRLTYGNYVAKGKLGLSTYPGYSGTVFEPDDEYKGDLARTYFYMVTCYKNELPSWPGSPNMNYSQNKYKAFSTWTINMLMEWTRLDPVSDKEIKRNEAVYGIQGNRNPFIDHPELAEYIWGDQQGQPWNGSGGETSATITSPANGSTIDMGTTTVGTELRYTVTVKGTGLNKWLSLSMSDNRNFYVSAVAFNPLDVNNGTSFVITFTAENAGTYENQVTLSSDEVSTTFTITATAEKQGDTPPPSGQDDITEDWEDCTTGGYWTKQVQGNAFLWYFRDAGIWSDSMSHGELSCRFGKTNNSAIIMMEDVEDATGIGFYATCFGNDGDAELSIAYSTDQGSSWYGLDVVTITRGALQQYILDVESSWPLRFGISQVSGSRVIIDDITVYRQKEETQLKGDVNRDGEVNIADVNTLIDAILSGISDINCDVNEDAEVNIADVNSVIDIILGS